MELVIKLLQEKKEELENIKISPNFESMAWKEEFLRQINDAIEILHYEYYLREQEEVYK
jgi:hypothetical protein